VFNMSLPLVSVIVRAYNPNEWIFEAVNSIIKQTYEGRIEVIVCYDKTSHTSEILDKLKEMAKQVSGNRVVRIIEHEPASPAKAFFECGLQASNGDYILFLDYDNVMPENYISEAIKQAKDHDCLCTNPTLMNEKGEILGNRLLNKIPSKISITNLARGNLCDTNGIILSRKAVNMVLELYNKHLKRLRQLTYLIFDDYLVALVCAKIFGIKYINNISTYYRVHENQLVHNPSNDNMKQNQRRLQHMATLYITLSMLNRELSLLQKLYIGAIMIVLTFKIILSTLKNQ